MTDTCYECDSCKKLLDLNWATCVTNEKEHLHADSPKCIAELERKLGTLMSKAKPKATKVVPFPGAAAVMKRKGK